jgi:hypothetical protein
MCPRSRLLPRSRGNDAGSVASTLCKASSCASGRALSFRPAHALRGGEPAPHLMQGSARRRGRLVLTLLWSFENRRTGYCSNRTSSRLPLTSMAKLTARYRRGHQAGHVCRPDRRAPARASLSCSASNSPEIFGETLLPLLFKAVELVG